MSVIFVEPEAGRRVEVLGLPITYKLTGAETGEQVTVMLEAIPPGRGAPHHSHGDYTESFYVLEGRLLFEGPDGRREVGPGTLIHVPRGTDHAFLNRSADQTARMLTFYAPGGRQERLFDALAEAGAGGGPPDMAKLAAAAAPLGSALTGPPPAP